MKTLLNTHALADALTAFEDSLTPNEEPLAPDEDGGVNAAAACYRQPEKHAYFAVDLAAITELGSREPAQAFSQQFAASLASRAAKSRCRNTGRRDHQTRPHHHRRQDNG